MLAMKWKKEKVKRHKVGIRKGKRGVGMSGEGTKGCQMITVNFGKKKEEQSLFPMCTKGEKPQSSGKSWTWQKRGDPVKKKIDRNTQKGKERLGKSEKTQKRKETGTKGGDGPKKKGCGSK